MFKSNISEAKADSSDKLVGTNHQDDTSGEKRIGAAKGKFTIHGDFEACNQEIADIFQGAI